MTECTVENLERCLNSPLDKVEEKYGQIRVEFYEDEAAFYPTLVLTIENGVAKAASSSCLPTSGWKGVARAYGRAAGFMTLSGLGDGE